MKYIKLGRTELKVSRLGLGCSSFMSKYSAKHSKSIISGALNQGINFFDTARFYGQGGSEQILGQTLPKDAIISTKCGINFKNGVASQFLKHLKPIARTVVKLLPASRKVVRYAIRKNTTNNDFDFKSIEKSLNDSLSCLRRDTIDVMFLHNPSQEFIENGDALNTLNHFKKNGKIRYIGVSIEDLDTLAYFFMKQTSVDIVQLKINMYNIDSIKCYLELSRKYQYGIIGREPFSNGSVFNSNNELAPGSLSEEQKSFIARTCISNCLKPDAADSIIASMNTISHIKSNSAAVNLYVS